MACLKDIYKRLAFIAEWYQDEAAIVRTFTVFYFLMDNSVEIYEVRNKKLFLHRTVMPHLSEGDFFVGSKIDVFGRQFDIVGYADDSTKSSLAKFRKTTFILLKSTMIPELGKILRALIDSHFHINKALMVQLTQAQVKSFMGDRNKGDVQTTILMNELITSPSIGLEVSSDNAVDKMKNCQNLCEDCDKADMPAPLVELFKVKDYRVGIHCAQSDKEAAESSAFFFESKRSLISPLVLQNSTLCIIKPHAIKEGNLGNIITDITDKDFKITGLRMSLIERLNCAEFLNVYFSIIPEYIPMVTQLASGVCMALEIVSIDPSKNTFQEFRKFCGPKDPEIAKLLRPKTLRAKFGKSKVMNAVHCTDLEDDTHLELQYIFKIVK